MSTLKISDGVVKDEVLVLGLTSTNSKGGIAIEAGDMAIDTKTILSQLVDMGATGKADEITKLPGSHVRLLVFTGLGKKSSNYTHETLRRAAGSASRALAGKAAATCSLPENNLA
jgi:leucyl aminopeptidase